MIEPTGEMRLAFDEAPGAEKGCVCAVCLNHRLAAVFALVERDYDVIQKLPKVQHFEVSGSFRWNPAADEWVSKCICGEDFGGATPARVDELVLRHLGGQP